MNFDPDGSRIATLDWDGTIVLSDVNTGEYFFHLSVGKKGAACTLSSQEIRLLMCFVIGRTRNKCRWNPLHQVIAMCYDSSEFCLIDVERKSVTKPYFSKTSHKSI